MIYSHVRLDYDDDKWLKLGGGSIGDPAMKSMMSDEMWEREQAALAKEAREAEEEAEAKRQEAIADEQFWALIHGAPPSRARSMCCASTTLPPTASTGSRLPASANRSASPPRQRNDR
jgi:hypothetical protein